MPKVGILALQGDVREHAGALSDLSAHVVEVRNPEDLSGVDGLVLPGGESTTMSLLLDSAGLFGPIAERLSDGMPAFGTCAGMILLATEVLDGRPDQRSFAAIDISVRRNAFGRQVDSFEADLDVASLDIGDVGARPFGAGTHSSTPGGGDVRAAQPPAPPVVARMRRPLPAVFIRAPIVERTGPGVEILATIDGRPVLCRQGAVLAAAFHPELSGDLRLHQLFLGGL